MAGTAADIAQDYVAAKRLGDPEPAWNLICDAVESLDDEVEAYAAIELQSDTYMLVLMKDLGAVLLRDVDEVSIETQSLARCVAITASSGPSMEQ